ncbi:hypothetical protein [Pseudonocardia dioxanivorans]|uniref:hypothetical protein n=1 Tax=Pseudonocardia dioxanivorans TaxID=240495 RepID=UPI0039898C9A
MWRWHVVICSGTSHFEYVCDSVTAGLTRDALLRGRPVGQRRPHLQHHRPAIGGAGPPGSAEIKGAKAVSVAAGEQMLASIGAVAVVLLS